MIRKYTKKRRKNSVTVNRQKVARCDSLENARNYVGVLREPIILLPESLHLSQADDAAEQKCWTITTKWQGTKGMFEV